MTYCQECGKPLKSIGTERKNGKSSHGDWATREYHKCCWKKLENKKNNYLYYKGLCQLTEKNTLTDIILQKNL